ncbi:MAG TPA: prepilin peptidase [Stellaceae bacterium]|nr:prepilin peptidase [Stellaceae bacterium]
MTDLSPYLPPLLTAPFIGSFLGVVIRRLPAGEGLVLGRSRCPHCTTELGVADLVPLASWLALRGRCRHCGTDLGSFYPAVELAALAVAASVVLIAPRGNASQGDIWLDCAIGWTLIALAWIDAEQFVLPRMLTLPLMAAGLAVAAARGGDALLDSVMGATAGYLSLRLIGLAYRRLRGRDGLGLGDADLLAAAGAWLGWPLLPVLIAIAACAGLVAATAGHLAGHRMNAATAIPFGPFLALAFWGLYLAMNGGYMPMIGS